jgi:hypothetical protein
VISIALTGFSNPITTGAVAWARGDLGGGGPRLGGCGTAMPRTGTPDARLAEPERLYARKYEGAGVMHHTGHRAWLRLVPGKITSWDFRKKASVEDYEFG